MNPKSESRIFSYHEYKDLVREHLPTMQRLLQEGASYQKIAAILQQSDAPKIEWKRLAVHYDEVIADIKEEKATRVILQYEETRERLAKYGYEWPPAFPDADELSMIYAIVKRDGEGFKSELSNDRVLLASEPRELARLLQSAGVAFDNVFFAERREHGDIAPLPAQVFAVQQAMRKRVF